MKKKKMKKERGNHGYGIMKYLGTFDPLPETVHRLSLMIQSMRDLLEWRGKWPLRLIPRPGGTLN